MHVGEKEFGKTYMVTMEDAESSDGSELRQAEEIRPTTSLAAPTEVKGFQSRLNNRITKIVNDFVADKRSGKK